MNTRFKERSILKLMHKINTSELIFIDRKKNKDYKKVYKDIIYKLDLSNYKYSDYDTDPLYKGEKVHIFGLDNLYIKIKILHV